MAPAAFFAAALFSHSLVVVGAQNLHQALSQHCAQFTSCDSCSADPQCGFCLDDLSGKCLSGGCSRDNWVGRKCEDKQLQCIHAFKDLFPGSSFAEGPCSRVMQGNFAPRTCGGENHCASLASRMLSVCIDQKIPDIPPAMNPNAGKLFSKGRSKRMHQAFSRAGCSMPSVKSLKATPAPTPLATRSPTVFQAHAKMPSFHGSHHSHRQQQSEEAAFESQLANAKKNYVPPTPSPEKSNVPAASPQIQAENQQLFSIAIGCGMAMVVFAGIKIKQAVGNLQLQAIPPSPRGTELGTAEERTQLQYS